MELVVEQHGAKKLIQLTLSSGDSRWLRTMYTQWPRLADITTNITMLVGHQVGHDQERVLRSILTGLIECYRRHHDAGFSVWSKHAFVTIFNELSHVFDYSVSIEMHKAPPTDCSVYWDVLECSYHEFVVRHKPALDAGEASLVCHKNKHTLTDSMRRSMTILLLPRIYTRADLSMFGLTASVGKDTCYSSLDALMAQTEGNDKEQDDVRV
ncbi:hypothetical protein ACP3V5_17025 [Vibrio maritimus]